MKPSKGMWLTEKDSMRLSLIQSTDRKASVAAIARFLRLNTSRGGPRGSGPASPDKWYRQRARIRTV